MIELLTGGEIYQRLITAALGIGLLVTGERLIYLIPAAVNAGRLRVRVFNAVRLEGIGAALEICRATRGPAARVLQSGLLRAGRGLEQVERAIMTTGAIEMGFLEKNLIWLASIVTIAPMIGFLGTVTGIIGVFDAFAKTDTIAPRLIAEGIAGSLKTTIYGLSVAIPIHLVYSFLVLRVDQIVTGMEETAQELVDFLGVQEIAVRERPPHLPKPQRVAMKRSRAITNPVRATVLN